MTEDIDFFTLFHACALSGLNANPQVYRDIQSAQRVGRISPDGAREILNDEAVMVAEEMLDIIGSHKNPLRMSFAAEVIGGLLANPENTQVINKKIYSGCATPDAIPFMNAHKAVSIAEAMMSVREDVLMDVPIDDRERVDWLAGKTIGGLLANPERWREVQDAFERGTLNSDSASLANALTAYEQSVACLAADPAQKEDFEPSM